MSDGDTDILDLRFTQPATTAEVAQVRRRWRTFRTAVAIRPVRPFLVITPLGMPLRDEIAQRLAGAGIAPGRREAIANWPSASTILYVRTDTDERLRVALAFERLWRAIGLAQRAERWDLSDSRDLRTLITLKRQLHAQLGTVRCRLSIPGVVLRTPGQVVHLQGLHVPDPDTFEDESSALDALATE